MDENRSALLRRWSFTSTDMFNDTRICQQWFPGQRGVLDVLSVMDEAQVHEMADCRLPLFSVRAPIAANDGVFTSHAPQSEFHVEASAEVFMALISRLDALRTSLTQAAMLYDLPTSQVSWISRHSLRELQAVASDPVAVLLPTVADEYFVIAATTPMTLRERTALAGTARRKRAM